MTNITDILGQEKEFLERDLPMLKQVLKDVQEKRKELAEEEKELENLKTLVAATKAGVENLQKDTFKLMANDQRTEDDLKEYTQKFLLIKQEAQLINEIHAKLVQLHNKQAEEDRNQRPLFVAVQHHAHEFHYTVQQMQKAMFGTEEWYVVEMDRQLPEYTAKLKNRLPVRPR